MPDSLANSPMSIATVRVLTGALRPATTFAIRIGFPAGRYHDAMPAASSRYGLDALAQFLIDDPDRAVDFGIGHAKLM